MPRRRRGKKENWIAWWIDMEDNRREFVITRATYEEALEDAADYFDVTVDKIERWIKDGELALNSVEVV